MPAEDVSLSADEGLPVSQPLSNRLSRMLHGPGFHAVRSNSASRSEPGSVAPTVPGTPEKPARLRRCKVGTAG